MPINALFPLISMEYFNGTPVHISITEIAFASGMLVGGLLLGRLRLGVRTPSFFMPWPLRGTGEIQLLVLNYLMALWSLTMIKWLELFGAVSRTEWALLEGLQWVLI